MLFKELKKNHVSIWAYENKLKLAFTGETPPVQLIDKVKKKRENILTFLHEENIFSEEDFKRFTFNGIEVIFPATSLQQGFIYHHLTQPQDDAYRMQLLLDYHTNIDFTAYQQAWSLASLRFPILRTAFDWEGEILQIITAGASINSANFKSKDISQLPETERNKAIEAIQQHDRTLPFDLSQPGLIRFTFIKQNEQWVTVLITQHHCIADGWSNSILLQAVHEYYNQLIKRQVPQVDVEQAYLATQQYHLDHKVETEAYWAQRKTHFQGANDLSALLSQHVDLTLIKTVEKPAEQALIVRGDAYTQLKDMCRMQGVTLNVVLQFAWHKLLHSYTGDEQTIVGTTVSGRDVPVKGVESSVGLYINTLPLTVQWNQADSVAAILQEIQQDIAALNSHSAISLAGLQSDGKRLFHSLLVFENYPEPVANENEDGIENTLTFRQVFEKVDYPVSLKAYEQDNSLIVKLGYGEDWLTDKQAQRLLYQLERILHAVACDPHQLHTSILFLSEEERHTLLHTWNQTDAPYPQDKTLQQRFEVQAEKTPDNVALVFEGEILTYRQLNQRANQLARVIRERFQQYNDAPLQADTPIALYLDRSLEMVISILAVLKAGGAYVPISPEYPPERVQFILQDTGSLCVLTQKRHLATLAGSPISIAADDQTIIRDQSVENLVPVNKPTDLAYIIYTSGTTGQPKGVMIEHKNVAHLVAAQAELFDITKRKKALMFAAYVFDASVSELFLSLLHGLTVYLCSETERNAPAVAQLIQREGIEIVTLPPAILKLLVGTKLSSLQLLVTAGESPSLNFLDYFSHHCDVVNAYGPTEITVCATGKRYQHGDIASNIGKAVNNVRLYVFDKQDNLSPIGASGELYIGGAGLARGYLNHPELTAERFVPNPFATPEDKANGYTHLYKTGDLVRWLPNGELEYLGRNDFQVKIRGYRIELGEIESALTSHPQIKQAVVIDREHKGNKVLITYLVTDSTLSDDTLIRYLSTRLPNYMLPANFTRIESIPLTLNGKLDRRALPEPKWENRDSYIAPRNDLETQLCAIWREVLGLERIGIEDNFFRVGGDSIISIKLVSRLRRAGFSLQVKSIFEAPTVERLAQLLTQTSSHVSVVAEQGLLNGEFGLLPIQQDFFNWNLSSPHHWNQAFMIRLPGNISHAAIEQTLIALTERHDMLRAHFINTEQGYRQCYPTGIPPWLPTLPHCDFNELDQQQLTQWQSGFNYCTGPLWQAAHLTGYSDGSARVFFAFHHLIIDVVSWRIIAEDMRRLLQGETLPAKTSSYRQWVNAVHRYAEHHQQEILYWQQAMAENHVYSASHEMSQHRLSVSAELTDILLREANAGYHTEINDLLLSALTLALQTIFSHPVNHIMLEGHGREAIDNTLDVSETVGWFTTTYPVRLVMQDNIAETIIHTKEMLRAVPNKGIGYGALRQAGYLSEDLPIIGFNYLGQLGTGTEQNWSLISDDCGTVVADDNHSHLLLNINGLIQTGRLQFSLSSSLSQTQTQKFITAFEQALNSVITAGQKQAQLGGIKTPSDYGIEGISIKLLRHLQQTYQIEALYPATSLQQGFIYHHLAQPQDDAYRVQLLLDYHTQLDLAAYQQAWVLTSLRFPILRTAFNWEEEVLQIVTDGASLDSTNFITKDISHLPSEEKVRAIKAIQQHDRTLPFDLRQPGLIRFTLIKQREQRVTVLITQHHSITDGWSNPILLQNVHEYYNQLAQKRVPQIVADKAYLATQQYYLEHKAGSEIYWEKRKAQFQGTNNLSALLSHHVDLNLIRAIEKPARQTISVQENVYQQLKKMCREQGITLNVVLQFAWHKLLHSYTGDEQTIVGTTVSGRDIPVDGIESSVGLYINTLPLMVQWDNTHRVISVLQAIQKDIAALNSHSAVSLASLQSDGERLFHSLFVFENYPIPVANENEGGIENTLIFRQAIEKVDYPVSLMAYEQNNCLTVKLGYGEDWLTDKQAQRLLHQLERILHAVAGDPHQLHTTILFLSEAERYTLLHTWNQTDAPYPQDKTLQQLFEVQAERTPDNVVLVFEGETLTYRQLNQRANQLARVIREHYQQYKEAPLPADTPIALYLDRSLEMVISILAVLKAGGAYVPISPAYPPERVQFILQDTQSPCVLTQQHYLTALAEYTQALRKPPIRIAADDQTLTRDQSVENLASVNNPADLAYIIYTSGTTGQPKGVMIEHKNVAHLVAAQAALFDITKRKKALMFAAYVFDGSVFELFSSLLHGLTVYLCSETERNAPAVAQLIQREGIEIAALPPAILKLLIGTEFPSLQLLVTAGEAPSLDFLDYFSHHSDVFNSYGPTEVTVCASGKHYQSGEIARNIGRAINNARLYVVDKQGNLSPIGATGELYIGGAGLARGYLNRPELTAERFVENPFASAADKARGYTRLYKTGDLVRWLPNGELEYLGRNDFQVKIRGYRIELGEIENALTSHPQVKQAVVTDHEHNGNQVLVAYLVTEGELSDDTLIRYLSTRLPDYMLPASFTRIESVPLTLNGKLDRRALPAPVWDNRDSYIVPRNALEAQLCAIWQEVLGLERVGIEDNFFRIGGNSLTAIKLTAAIHHTLGLEVSLTQLFERKTIAGLVTQRGQPVNTVIPHREQEHYPLSFAQERMLFIEQFEQGTDAYHIPYLVQLDNAACLPVLETAINRLAQRHAVIRTVYPHHDGGQHYQQILDRPLVIRAIPPCDDIDTLLDTIRTETATPFDLTTEPGLRLCHYALADKHYFLMLWHHIAIDGWAIDIFMRELAEIYPALLAGRDSRLPVLDITYGDYAAWQREYLQGDVRERQLAYWRQTLAHYETLALPTDAPRPAQVSYQGRDFNFTLDAPLSDQLRMLAKNQETTLYTVLLSGFYVTLAKLSGQNDIVLGTPTDNRHHAQTQSLIGMFVNSLVLRAQLVLTDNVATLIQQIHQLLADAKAHQDMPFEQLLDALAIERDPARHPIFQVMFGLHRVGEHRPDEARLPFQPVTLDESLYSPAKFDLSLFLSEGQPAITGNLNYAVSLFNDTTMARLAAIYQRVLAAFVTDPQQSLAGIDILSAPERHTLLHTWNQTDAPYPQEKTLQQLFEVQAAKTPDNIALVFEGETLTYRQLNQRANQLARIIREHCAPMPANTPIALYLDRSLEMVISILAVLKAGGAYVPISPAYPPERVQFILQDTQSPCLLTQQRYLTALAEYAQARAEPPIRIAADDQTLTRNQSVENLASVNNPADLAYIIYTSGTTGQPKGVMIEHKNVAHLVAAQATLFDIAKRKKALMFAAYVFDASVSELFVSLLHGLTVYLCSETERNAPAIAQLIQREGIELATLPPAILKMLIGTELPSLQLLVTAGEAPSLDFLDYFSHHCEVLNAYGPTEVTVCASGKHYQSGEMANNIGKAINNVRLYVIDQQGHPSPIGTPGELYIGGAGLARGYLNRPELTAERFVENPFASEADKACGYTRLYKTGDLVRWRPNGELEYLGRNDFQVKIRGYRIELGEIENALTSHSQVKQAVVIDHEHKGDQILVAYLVTDGVLHDDTLVRYLSTRLPDYMLPANFTRIESVPLTLNGKLDRRALPTPVWGKSDNYIVPRNALEAQLCAIWQDVLGLERVSIEDNFFRIGGNSLIAIKLTTAMRNEINVDIPLNILFSYKCISLLSQWLEAGSATSNLLNFLTPESTASNKLFMIHAVNCGSEVYEPLANVLSDTYNCIGIDNYNLSTEHKIDSLRQIAQIYMQLILTETSIDKPIRILGWSLGGQLAIEIAFQLEQLGAKEIQLFLLDTVINNDEIKELRNKLDISNAYNKVVRKLQEMGANETYINKVLEAIPFESEIANCHLSGKLAHTNITLFKAGQANPHHKEEAGLTMSQLIIKTPDNNISQWSIKPLVIKLIDDCYHENIIESVSSISAEIINTLSIKDDISI
ncbi:non-ribosomal peptide synthetase [Xenorhabdus sp. BG5]|uniref:non-ribosomal peptide synthetase n=1 Tax=Xenorhabdus sp. BG5 TaxID=2782014 RepID=UPI001D151A73|nr:non-ribosomal peptide synthetase [Xenorhabdus sp. BG5]